MNELDYMRQSLAKLYNSLEELLQRYGSNPAYSNDELYRELSDLVHVVDAPNDTGSNGGKGYYCKNGKWHGQWPAED